jgi:hypothetical protein
MTVPQVCLDAGDAIELGELLGFLDDWLACDRARLAGSLGRFVGSDGYGIDQLHEDLSRFGFLLGFSDGERLFGGDPR